MNRLMLNPNDDIQAILDGLPFNDPIEVILQPGIYRQKLRLKQDHLRIIGHSPEDTVLIYGDFAWKYHEDGRLFNTFRTPTVTVLGDDVELSELTIQNDAGSGPSVGQAVALAIYGDQVRLFHCQVLGHQDTLFSGPLPEDLRIRYHGFIPEAELRGGLARHSFEKCVIAGDVDFIFGSGHAWFKDCEIQILGPGYITAPSTAEADPYGFIFTDCRIRNLTPDAHVFLGRPWRAGGATFYLNCVFEGAFAEPRWDAWGKPYFRFLEHPFVESSLSSDVSGEEAERVRADFSKHFTRS